MFYYMTAIFSDVAYDPMSFTLYTIANATCAAKTCHVTRDL